VIAHSVSAISIQSVVGLEALPAEPDNAATALRNIRKVSGTALAELRGAVGVLRDADGAAASAGEDPATDLTPVAGLADLAGLVATASASGLQVTVVSVGAGGPEGGSDRRLPVVVDATAHRIVQESITNVLRHSDAARALVEIHYRPTEVKLRISNTAEDQLAPALPARPTGAAGGAGGYGIAGMRERVALLGGTLTAAPTVGGGFQVDAVLPFSMPAL
jgi:signal transduction histidine kinase